MEILLLLFLIDGLKDHNYNFVVQVDVDILIRSFGKLVHTSTVQVGWVKVLTSSRSWLILVEIILYDRC